MTSFTEHPDAAIQVVKKEEKIVVASIRVGIFGPIRGEITRFWLLFFSWLLFGLF